MTASICPNPSLIKIVSLLFRSLASSSPTATIFYCHKLRLAIFFREITRRITAQLQLSTPRCHIHKHRHLSAYISFLWHQHCILLSILSSTPLREVFTSSSPLRASATSPAVIFFLLIRRPGERPSTNARQFNFLVWISSHGFFLNVVLSSKVRVFLSLVHLP